MTKAQLARLRPGDWIRRIGESDGTATWIVQEKSYPWGRKFVSLRGQSYMGVKSLADLNPTEWEKKDKRHFLRPIPRERRGKSRRVTKTVTHAPVVESPREPYSFPSLGLSFIPLVRVLALTNSFLPNIRGLNVRA